MVEEVLVIDRLGARGDGIAAREDGTVYVGFALPGETVRVRRHGDRAEILEIVEPSPDRRQPICPHFGDCGGCAVQHIGVNAYETWKQAMASEALRRQGIATDVRRIIPVGDRSRRRAVLTARRRRGQTRLGYHQRGGHGFVALETCPVLSATIEQAFPALIQIADTLMPDNGSLRMTVTECTNGLDVGVASSQDRKRDRRRQNLDPFVVMDLSGSLASMGIVKLTYDDELLFSETEPVVKLSDVTVSLPSGAFIQAVATAEQAMVSVACDALAVCEQVADLFAGLGTFSFALARRASVLAVESDAAFLAALAEAAKHCTGLKPIKTRQRDLYNNPMAKSELSTFDGIVFDPPRAGAPAQAHEIAKSGIDHIVGVSCSPATFARDARILIDGGYYLEFVQPIDQFKYSHHVELVGVFRKDR